MEMLQDSKNKLLERRELKFITEAAKNPSFLEAMETVAKEFKADKDLVSINKIKGKFGHGTFLIEALIYDNLAAREKIEKKKVEKKVEA